jgi:DNA repair exonuclease SbcCD ATPase subunit
MLISQILLKNFGKFKNFTCELTPGLNLIKGPNEAGKSTLADAITAALFLYPTEGKKEMVGAANWKSKEAPALEATFNVGGNSVKLIKDFKTGSVELEDNRTGVKTEETDYIEKWLAEQLGISSEEIFKATACISQGELSHIEESFDAIKDKLESLITGGREDQAASQTTARIEKRIKEISGQDGVSGGLLEELNKQADEMNYNIERLNRAIANLKARRGDLIQVQMAYKNMHEDLEARKERYEKSKKAGKLEEAYIKTSKDYHELEVKMGDIQESLKKIKGLRDRETGIKKIEAKDVKEIDSIHSHLIYMRPKHNELEADRNEAKNESAAYKVGKIYGICAILGFAGAIASALSQFDIFFAILKPWSVYGLLGSGILIVFGLALINSRKHHKKYLKERFEKLEAKLVELDTELGRQTTFLKTVLTRYAADSVEDLKRNLWQRDDLEKQIAREKEIYDSLLGENTLQDMEQRYESLQQEIEAVKRDKRELSQYIVDEADLARQAQVISQYEERRRDLERERMVLCQQIETAEGGAELLASFMERREHLKSRAEKLLHDVAILQLTANCVNEARQDVLVSTLDVLNAKTSEIINKLTSGRYSRVRFDKSTMKFEIYSDDKGQWLQPEKGLSNGTLDQVYLAARLALADIVSEHKNPPMILDDPFVSYDEKRLENAMKVLKDLSANHQILLLTSQSHYDRWADSTITL